jgi:hypothetical protein
LQNHTIDQRKMDFSIFGLISERKILSALTFRFSERQGFSAGRLLGQGAHAGPAEAADGQRLPHPPLHRRQDLKAC